MSPGGDLMFELLRSGSPGYHYERGGHGPWGTELELWMILSVHRIVLSTHVHRGHYTFRWEQWIHLPEGMGPEKNPLATEACRGRIVWLFSPC